MFGAIPPGADPVLLGGFAAYSAAGGIFNISSSNWFRDKGYGMGKEVGFISGAIGGEKINVAPTGIAFRPTQENLRRWKGWLHFVRVLVEVKEKVRLFVDGGHDFGVAVTGVGDPDSAGEIQVASVIMIPDISPFSLHEYGINKMRNSFGQESHVFLQIIHSFAPF